ncbi:MAG: hypothetical protein RIR62_2303 [Pseudomonadota bacterium]|jgi:hypothetical protein
MADDVVNHDAAQTAARPKPAAATAWPKGWWLVPMVLAGLLFWAALFHVLFA